MDSIAGTSASSPILGKHKVFIVFLGIWALTTAYLLLFPTRHFTFDGINNLAPIEEHNVFELWHTQHLLGLFPAYWGYVLAGGALRSWQVIRLVNALMGGATVAIVFLSLQLLTRKLWIALASAGMLWFSYGFWHYNTESEIYSIGLLSVALLMLAYIDYLRLPTLLPTLGRAARLGLAAAFSILAHQLNIEFAGLIGLSLIWIAWRSDADQRPKIWRQVVLYALSVIVLVPAVYGIGWLSVRAYFAQSNRPMDTFGNWALRYFGMAQTGQVTWGSTLHLAALPKTGYGILSSWTLPPLVHNISIVQGLLLVAIGVGTAIFILHGMVVLRRCPMPQRLVVIVCSVTVLANIFSTWWWEAGNVKFSLFMQIQIVVLGGLYLSQALQPAQGNRWTPRFSFLALGLLAVGLIGSHLLFTLPYETQGGIFAVADLEKGSSKSVWFDISNYAIEYGMISSSAGHILPDGFCQRPSTDVIFSNAIWVVNENTASHCLAMTNATRLGDFQTDRSREQWGIFSITP